MFISIVGHDMLKRKIAEAGDTLIVIAFMQSNSIHWDKVSHGLMTFAEIHPNVTFIRSVIPDDKRKKASPISFTIIRKNVILREFQDDGVVHLPMILIPYCSVNNSSAEIQTVKR